MTDSERRRTVEGGKYRVLHNRPMTALPSVNKRTARKIRRAIARNETQSPGARARTGATSRRRSLLATVRRTIRRLLGYPPTAPNSRTPGRRG